MIPKRKRHIKSRLWLMLLIAALCAGYWGEMLYMRPTNTDRLKSDIELHIKQKRKDLKSGLATLEKVHLELNDSLDFVYSDRWKKQANNGLTFLIYKNDSLIFWNSNELVIPGSYIFKDAAPTLLRLRNANIIWNKIEKGDYIYIGILPIQMVYPIRNDFIQSHFNPDLGIPEFTPFSHSASPDWTLIKDEDGQILFYLDLAETSGRIAAFKYLSLIGYVLAIMFFLMLWAAQIARFTSRRKQIWMVLSILPFTFLLIVLIGFFNAPAIFYETRLFSPEIFGMPGVFGNLGIVLMFSLLWLYFGVLYFRYVSFLVKSRLQSGIMMFLILIAFHELVRLYLNLVGHSTISFELNNIPQLDLYSLIAHLALLSLFGGWFLVADKTIATILLSKKERNVSLIIGLLGCMLVMVYLYMGMIQMAIPFAIAIALLGFSLYTHRRSGGGTTILTLFTLSIFFAVLGVSLTWSFGRELDRAKETTLLMNRASGIHNEHDPFAEMGLMAINKQLSSDRQLTKLFRSAESDVERIDRYVHQRFFNENWRQYDVQVVLCWPESVLDISGQEDQNNCYGYFQQMIAEYGEELDGNGLFYLNNKNGRISYFIWQKKNAGKTNEVSLFIDIESRLRSVGRGYPELVKDIGSSEGKLPPGYSFARYVDNVLISNSGEFSYNISANWVNRDEDEFSIQTYDGFQHLVYSPSHDSYYILSKLTPDFTDVLLYFIYLFLYLFILIFIFSTATNFWKGDLSGYSRTLESRIRSAILFILLLSFVLIGFASVHYNRKQFRYEQVESLKDKTRSVLVMLDQLTGGTDVIYDMDPVGLVANLRNISNSLYADINLYGKNGHLLASSRPELFIKCLQGREMNAAAYKDLNNDLLPWSLQEESLGNKTYLSAYKGIYNWENKLMAYVNLPHFVSAEEASEEQLNFVVVILNIYLIFVVLAIFLTVILSRQITRPLQVIKEKLSGFRLRERNEKIHYSGRDEIASLVKEYNRLVDELETGAEQLVTSERTSAWRQMARQIAHEIKNPLTPMKLSIQHLQRAKKDHHEKFDEFFEKTSKTLIEQIDNLSRIATEFSSFSKITAASPEKLDVCEPVKNVVELFKESENIEVKLHGIKENLFVWADKEQLIQVFNNLIKNATQAMPQEQEGLIDIELSDDESAIIISVKDNGTGIAEEAKAKLFEPNFTTKRTGMGIGLAITRNIIHSFNGEIWFEENEPKGTIFYVKLPKYTFS